MNVVWGFSMLFVILLFGVAMMPLVMQENTADNSVAEPPDPDNDPDDGNLRGTQRADLLESAADTTLIQGLDGDDTLSVDPDHTDVMVKAGHGNDEVTAGDDVNILGGAGEDTITAGGFATIAGGSGDDLITAGDFSSIDGGTGDDSIRADVGDQNGIEGTDTSTIFGGDGDDTITAGTDATIDGGAGNDDLQGWIGSVIDGGDGNDDLWAHSDATLSGGAGDDTIRGEAGAVIATGTGSDIVVINMDRPDEDTWNDGIVTVSDYVAGQDVYFFDFHNFTPVRELPDTFGPTQDGDDVVFGGQSGGPVILRLTDVALGDLDNTDFLTGAFSNYDNYLAELAAGTITVTGTTGADTLTGDLHTRQIDGLGGNDTIGISERASENFFPVTINGGEGDDSIDAAIGTTLTTGAGADTVNVAADYPRFVNRWDAGPVAVTDYVEGQDVYLLNTPDTGWNAPQADGTVRFAQDDADVVVSVNGVGFVRLMGVTLAEVNAADFVLDPRAEPPVITGTDGADTLTAFEETTRIDGLGGNDSITSAIEFVEAVFDGGDGNDTIQVGISATVVGGAGDDVIRGQDLTTIDGGAGNDSISAGPGSVVATGTGEDSVTIGLDINFARDTWNHGPVTITDYVPGQDEYLLAGNLIQDRVTGEPIGRGTLELIETADAVVARVNGINYFRLPGLTLADINAADFVLDPPSTAPLI